MQGMCKANTAQSVPTESKVLAEGAACAESSVCLQHDATELAAVAAYQLGIEMAQAQHSARHLPHYSKGFYQKAVQCCPSPQALPELCSLAFELLVCHLLHTWLQLVHLFDHLEVSALRSTQLNDPAARCHCIHDRQACMHAMWQKGEMTISPTVQQDQLLQSRLCVVTLTFRAPFACRLPWS